MGFWGGFAQLQPAPVWGMSLNLVIGEVLMSVEDPRVGPLIGMFRGAFTLDPRPEIFNLLERSDLFTDIVF